jgi:hypothetical protein
MEAIPIYPMMTTNIPRIVLQEAERLQRSFIWGDSNEGKKHHTVNWEVVTRPKELGCLGLRRLEVMNNACIMKLAWEFYRNNPGLWCSVLKGKYGRGTVELSHVISKPNDSSLWKALVRLKPQIEEHSVCSIGNDRNTLAWKACWIAPGMRIAELDVDIPNNIIDTTVADLTDASGSWNWSLLQDWLPATIMQKLAAIPIPEDENEGDTQIWPHGDFTVSSAYYLLAEYDQNDEDKVWNQI